MNPVEPDTLKTDAESFPWKRLDAVIRHDPGGRGVARLERENDLKSACEALLACDSFLIVTGFLHLESGEPETDGLSGSLFLGKCLEVLGKSVHWITDAPCRTPLEEAGAVPLIVPDLEGLSLAQRQERLFEVLDLVEADAVLFVERPGRGKDGLYRNIRGDSVPAAPFDEFLLLGPNAKIVTFAIGDGGNEAGMGSLSEAEHKAFGAGESASVTPADHLIVSGISDWGAYALITGLSWLTDQPLLPHPEYLEATFQTLLEVGAVDGVTGDSTWTLDGVPLEETLGLLKELSQLA